MKKKWKTKWPKLTALFEQGDLLYSDLACVEQIAPQASETEAATLAATVKASREGHLALTPSLLPSLPLGLQKLITLAKSVALDKDASIEERIVSHVLRLLKKPSRIKPLQNVPSNLSPEQKSFFEMCHKHSLIALSGGAGTGKTFTAAKLIEAAQIRAIVSAPTGKATARLLQAARPLASNIKGATLHSLLRFRAQEGLSICTHGQPPLLSYPLVIVDECSMIDPLLFETLLRNIGEETTLILMGDPSQIPAIEGGSIFADLLPWIPNTTLTTSFRSNRAEILHLAQTIRMGDGSLLQKQFPSVDLGFSSQEIGFIYQKLLRYSDAHFPSNWQEQEAFRIVTPLRQGPFGTIALNQLFFNHHIQKSPLVPIIITKNDPNTTLANGDLGVLSFETNQAHFPDKGSFPRSKLTAFEYAYCLSVHKSQGSEYRHVLVLIPPGSAEFGREMVYTAVTRAQEKLDISGDLSELVAALQKSSHKASTLAERFSAIQNHSNPNLTVISI